ncbi:MAG: biotin synthase BioB [Nitrospiraceae bacterium]|nr:biotin synthase BioB [Nitrospiraceae bacterium]
MDSPFDKDINSLLGLSTPELVLYANKVRRDFIGSRLELCSILNAKSGACTEDCKFCAQSSRYSTHISVYPLLKKEKILKAAEDASEIGAERFSIVTSGRRLNPREFNYIVETISLIREKIDIKVCASLGSLKVEELRILKDAGLSRYHHNIETSARYYSEVVTTHSFQERIDTIHSAKAADIEVCSGGIIGMGETWQDRIDMACLLKKLDVESIPINILVPIKGTPFGSMEPISCRDIIRTICIFRIILKDKIIKVAAGRERTLKDFQGLGFMAGANGMIIGGYLTIKGRSVEADHQLVKEIKELWRE